MKRLVAMCLVLLLGLMSVNVVAEEVDGVYYCAYSPGGMSTVMSSEFPEAWKEVGWQELVEMNWYWEDKRLDLDAKSVKYEEVEELYKQGYVLRADYIWKSTKKVKYLENKIQKNYTGYYEYALESAKEYYLTLPEVKVFEGVFIDGRQHRGKLSKKDWEALKKDNWQRGAYYSWVYLPEDGFVYEEKVKGFLYGYGIEKPTGNESKEYLDECWLEITTYCTKRFENGDRVEFMIGEFDTLGYDTITHFKVEDAFEDVEKYLASAEYKELVEYFGWGLNVLLVDDESLFKPKFYEACETY